MNRIRKTGAAEGETVAPVRVRNARCRRCGGAVFFRPGKGVMFCSDCATRKAVARLLLAAAAGGGD